MRALREQPERFLATVQIGITVIGAAYLTFGLAGIIVLGIGNAEANESITYAGGYIGIATAIAAWYASFAAVTNSTFGRTVLPVKELKR